MKQRLLFFFLFLCLKTFAQDSTRIANDDITILFRNEAEGGINIHSNGFGLTFKRGWHLTGYKKQMLDIDFVSLRDPKQYKLSNYPDSKSFFYGKLNFAYILRGGYGIQNIIFGKAERNWGFEILRNDYTYFQH